jgi:REP element-mobilizing transposase RayT
MPRRPRSDEPGAWHHVFNRGLARRTLFECDRDIRKFLALFARTVRAGRIEVHAYCVLTTHFHFLVRSPLGELSGAMQWIQNQYVRWFNRGRRRDGPLLRGRFGSKRADSLTYRRHLVRYIDFNAVAARLAPAPALYPHGSARHFAQVRSPRWLARTWIDGEIGESELDGRSRSARYTDRFGDALPPALLEWVERRAQWPSNDPDALDDLLAAAPERVLDWMRRKARVADGSRIGLPVCTAAAVEAEIERSRSARGDWRIELERGDASALALLHVGLLRDLCAATLAQLAAATSLSTTGVWSKARRHSALLESDARYAEAAGSLASAALHACHGGLGRPPLARVR